MIIIGGMIGLGKTSYAEILGNYFKCKVFYENVDDNKILPLFYKSTEEEIQKKRYSILLQLWFLESKYQALKEALLEENSIVDRSLFEDWYFAKKNMELGRISEMEMEVYEFLFHQRMKDLAIPDDEVIFIYLKGSFETVLKRIAKRGREFEISESLKEYYHFLWEGYDAWIYEHIKRECIVEINVDDFDVLYQEQHRIELLQKVEKCIKLKK